MRWHFPADISSSSAMCILYMKYIVHAYHISHGSSCMPTQAYYVPLGVQGYSSIYSPLLRYLWYTCRGTYCFCMSCPDCTASYCKPSIQICRSNWLNCCTSSFINTPHETRQSDVVQRRRTPYRVPNASAYMPGMHWYYTNQRTIYEGPSYYTSTSIYIGPSIASKHRETHGFVYLPQVPYLLMATYSSQPIKSSL